MAKNISKPSTEEQLNAEWDAAEERDANHLTLEGDGNVGEKPRPVEVLSGAEVQSQAEYVLGY
jgi:hypothetical protein